MHIKILQREGGVEGEREENETNDHTHQRDLEERTPPHPNQGEWLLRCVPYPEQDMARASSTRSPPTVYPLDVSKSRFPYAIVWSPIPLLTWILPFVGHMGICNSEGKIFDFAGPYTIGVDQMAFGCPTRYLLLKPRKAVAKSWDEALAGGCAIYSERVHNLCCDNCHSHVARCLNDMEYGGTRSWNMITLCFWVFFCAPYTNWGGCLRSWLPFLIFVGVIVGISQLTR